MDKPTRREERWREDRDAIREALDKLTNLTLRTLDQRGERVVRGSVEGEPGRAGKGTVAEPTARVALEGLPNDEGSPDVWRERADAVGKAIAEAAGLLDLAAVTMGALADKVQWVLNISDDEFALIGQHKTAGICRACQRKVTGSVDDRLRSGYCNACRVAWDRRMASWTGPGAPDRVVFEAERLKKADQERKAS